MQVRNTCDIIVNKFPQIVDLILIHGTWNLNRIINILMYSLYANLLIIIPYFYQQNNIQIGASFFNVNYLKLIMDILLIDLMILCILCLDQNIDRSLIGLSPSIYQYNKKHKEEILNLFFTSIIKAIVDSIIIFFFINNTHSVNIVGEVADINMSGTMINYTCYLLIILKLLLIVIRTINYMTIFISFIFVCGLIGLVFLNEEILISCIYNLSFLSLIMISILIICFCIIYEFFLFI